MPEAAMTQRSRGMHDLTPDEMDRVRAAEAAFAQTCRLWGYREIRTPVIEPLHLFTAAGTLSPHTLDGVYSFLDWDGWSGERVVLRPDSTIPAARLYAERLAESAPARLFYRQNVFRFADDGSSREEWQCGVELIGDTGTAGDTELVLLALDVLRAAGVQAPVVRLSHASIVRGVLAAAGMTADEQSRAYDRLLDGDMSVVGEVESRMPQLNAPLRLLFEVEGAGSGYLANLRGSLVAAIPAIEPALDELTFIVAALEAAGVAPIIQAVLARSFEYYSGMVMKIDAGGERVCTGGRYDELIGLISGTPTPASGFGIYVTPLLAATAATSAELLPAAVLVQPASASADDFARAAVAAASLRATGIRAELSASAGSGGVVTASADGLVLERDGGKARFADVDDLARVLGARPSESAR